jgi:hypothetical protein
MAADNHNSEARWPLHTDRFPFQHIIVDNFLPASVFLGLRGMLDGLLERGFSDEHNLSRMSKIPGYDCYCWVFPPDVPEPVNFFTTRGFQVRMGEIFGVTYSGEVSCQFNFHRPGARDGSWHDDYVVGYHTEESRRPDGVNIWHYGCNLLGENSPRPGRTIIERCRALAFLYYLGADTLEEPVDGGSTVLGYDNPLGNGVALFRAIAPVPNRLLAFECSPLSLHRNLANPCSARALLIGWLHTTPEVAQRRHGAWPGYWCRDAALGQFDFNAP